MMTIALYRTDLKTAYESLHYRKTAYAELRLLCLWTVVGLTLTSVFLLVGLGTEIEQALMMAG